MVTGRESMAFLRMIEIRDDGADMNMNLTPLSDDDFRECKFRILPEMSELV
jgi:hypothetical protein